MNPLSPPLFSRLQESYSLSPINVTLNLSAMTGSDVNDSDGPIAPRALLIPVFDPLDIIPHPGQSGAMKIDGRKITKFLDEWNLKCEDFGLGATQRFA